MLDILETAHNKLHELGGKPNTLTVGDKLLITLKYQREYATMESLADDDDCSKSSICRLCPLKTSMKRNVMPCL